MKTFSLKPADVKRKWYVLDASTVPLGRLSTHAASLLIGKGKPEFTPHVDGGDYVVVINAGQLQVTGNKRLDKIYSNHSGYPSGLRQRRLGEINPVEVLEMSIRGMLPVNKLRPGRLSRLKIYTGNEHPHEPQSPTIYEMKGTK